ncbi:hypothetical protein CDLVIII_5019 [Clostridium sp. DL-VIII]|uniref:hypothetical protein n=1 Tax=Clostridium sp. DL-VIII TaxID=641107 RepID=UPI00023B063F|nr:hypothetical protein [Clostridium sp. DL-VIII]EHJ01510.1 hypothetical protein CDLVIII_5019 [Clostridium sp. DL-VIII]
MEFKLNKIDTDIRKKIQEETKIDKIHPSRSISIKKDIKEKKDEEKEHFHKEENNEKRYITIDGVKYSHKNIDINAEKIENITEEDSKGRILDTTK